MGETINKKNKKEKTQNRNQNTQNRKTNTKRIIKKHKQ